MRRTLLILAPSLFLAGSLAVVVGADSLAPETLRLARIESRAKIGLSSIPAYSCAETMERSTRSSSRLFFHKVDDVKLEVAEIGGKELFSKPGEASFHDLSLKEMVGRGLVATGMFYHIAQTVFGSPVARFQFVGHKRLKGHKTVQYDLTVSPLFANYHLQFNNHGANCGFRGSIWADETSLDVVRLRFEATEVPLELLLRSAVTEIDYNRASFDGKSFLIPASADILIVFQNGEESRNRIRFSSCRKYEVNSTLVFQ